MTAGCGSGGNGEPGSGTGAAAQLAPAQRQINRFRAMPAFVEPGPAFDAVSRLRGKTVFEIPITSEVPFIAGVEGGMRQAAARVGAHLVAYPNQGNPSEWAQGIRTAIADRAAAIVLLAEDPRLLAPQIAEARRAGIPVVVARTTGEGESCQTDASGRPYGSACVPGRSSKQGVWKRIG
jgi:ribose transport system substrate-binding protein